MTRHGLSQTPGTLVLIVVGVIFLVVAMALVVFAQGEGKGLFHRISDLSDVTGGLNPVPDASGENGSDGNDSESSSPGAEDDNSSSGDGMIPTG